jgi:hypothetical protein
MKKVIIAVTLALGSLVAGEIVMKVAGSEPKALPYVDEETRNKFDVLYAAAMVYQKHCQPALSNAQLTTLNDSARLMGAWRGEREDTAGTQVWIEQVQWSPDPEGWCAGSGNSIPQQLVRLSTLLARH